MTESVPAGEVADRPKDIDINPILTRLAERFSVRAYEDIPIDPGLIDTIIGDGIQAPSSCNQQVWHFVVVSDQALKKQASKISGLNPHFRDASVIIYLCFQKGWFHDKFSVVQSVAAAAYHMILSAHLRGLATIWNAGIGDTREVAALLDIPPVFEIQGALCIGYASPQTPRIKPPRRPVETVRSWNRFERPAAALYPLRQATDYPYWKISNTYNPYAVHDPSVWGWERIASFRGYSVWHKSPLAGVYVPKTQEGILEAGIAALPDLENGAAILEVMPYGGTYTTMMRRRYAPDVHIHFAELSELHTPFIEERLRQEGLSTNNLHPGVMDRGHLPYRDEQFDLVFLPQILEAVPEPEVLLDETRRVLKPGGQAVVSARNSISWFGWLFRRKLRRQPVPNFGPARPRPSFAIRRLLMQRFKMVDDFGMWPSPARRADRLHGVGRFFGRLYVARVVKG